MNKDAMDILCKVIRGEAFYPDVERFIEKYPDFEKNIPPRKAFNLILHISGHTYEEAVDGVRYFASVLHPYKVLESTYFSGAHGYCVPIIYPEYTKEGYFIRLENYLKGIRDEHNSAKSDSDPK